MLMMVHTVLPASTQVELLITSLLPSSDTASPHFVPLRVLPGSNIYCGMQCSCNIIMRSTWLLSTNVIFKTWVTFGSNVCRHQISDISNVLQHNDSVLLAVQFIFTVCNQCFSLRWL